MPGRLRSNRVGPAHGNRPVRRNRPDPDRADRAEGPTPGSPPRRRTAPPPGGPPSAPSPTTSGPNLDAQGEPRPQRGETARGAGPTPVPPASVRPGPSRPRSRTGRDPGSRRAGVAEARPLREADSQHSRAVVPPDPAESEGRFEEGKVRDEVPLRVRLRVRPRPVRDSARPCGQLVSLVGQQARVCEGPAGRRCGGVGPDDEPVVVPTVAPDHREPVTERPQDDAACSVGESHGRRVPRTAGPPDAERRAESRGLGSSVPAVGPRPPIRPHRPAEVTPGRGAGHARRTEPCCGRGGGMGGWRSRRSGRGTTVVRKGRTASGRECRGARGVVSPRVDRMLMVR